jgi:SAM-dependent methyltransferase
VRSKLNDPELVRQEYADESQFSVRQATWKLATGRNVHDVVIEALAAVSPRRVLEVGPGKGELAERMARELRVDVIAVDQSERMVELTRARGIHALVGDVRALPYEDDRFDAAVAAWMLYHVPDVELAITELARVLRSGGRLVAVTNSMENLLELWSLVGEGPKADYAFGRENGEEVLLSCFSEVERVDINGEVTFPDYEAARAHVAASPTRGDLAEALPRFTGPLVARQSVSVFVADKD